MDGCDSPRSWCCSRAEESPRKSLPTEWWRDVDHALWASVVGCSVPVRLVELVEEGGVGVALVEAAEGGDPSRYQPSLGRGEVEPAEGLLTLDGVLGEVAAEPVQPESHVDLGVAPDGGQEELLRRQRLEACVGRLPLEAERDQDVIDPARNIRL